MCNSIVRIVSRRKPDFLDHSFATFNQALINLLHYCNVVFVETASLQDTMEQALDIGLVGMGQVTQDW